MNTYAINFTDFTSHFWNMNWDPSTSKNSILSETDIQSVIHYIKTGNWPVPTSAAAKNCYDTLAAQIANSIIDDAAGSRRMGETVMIIERAYTENRLSKKGKALYERCVELCAGGPSEDKTLRMRKLLKKIIKNENLFAVKFAEDEDWCVEVFEDGMKCCICGESITDNTSHNPYPVRRESWYREKENRCCSRCNNQIVFPIRLRYGRHAPNYRENLMKMNHTQLLEFVHDIRYTA